MSASGEVASDFTFEQDLQQLLITELQSNEASLDQSQHDSQADGRAIREATPHDLDCPAHGSDALCTCNAISGLTGLNDLTKFNADGREAEDYANFESWIPTFVKPDQPCDYCRSKGLYCHMYFGKITCTACNSLFRPCSFARITNADASIPDANANHNKYTQHIDTLHTVQEDVCNERGAYTGIKMLRSKANASTPKLDADDSKKPAVRFSRAAVKVLRDWFDANQDHPYPTDEEKEELEKKTNLKSSQITTWLANTRRRSKVGKGPRRSFSPKPSSRSSASQPITVPAAQMAKEWRDLNPFERWQHSPPENEPAPMDAIADAVKTSSFLKNNGQSKSSEPNSLAIERGSSSASFSGKRPQSVTSLETGRESSNSRTGTTSSIAWSHGSSESFGSFNSFGSGLHGKRDRRRKRKVRIPLRKDETIDDKKRIFQCTFCCDTFKTKYDWTRHEKTLHLSLEKWICAPLGPVQTDPHTGVKTCVYCHQDNPSKDHLNSHSHGECESKGLEARTFYRKDHLRQHLRLMHHTTLQPNMESWKASADFINSRCGFCSARFTSWMERNDHLAAHFREGAHMRDWKRCRGLDPDVAANVLNAMPPYLIGMERDSPVPFSASRGTLSHSQTLMPGVRTDDQEGWPESERSIHPVTRDPEKATCWEILTISLGRYVKSQADAGVVVTDDMLQREARRILYESDDSWNQTAADNPEWLDLFKRAHGLDIIPSQLNGIGNVVPEDLELYTDLGMHIPFSVAQKAMTLPPSSGRPVPLPSSEKRLEGFSLTSPLPNAYRSYDEVPISAARAAHFEIQTSNPVIPRDIGQTAPAHWGLAQGEGQVSADLGPLGDELGIGMGMEMSEGMDGMEGVEGITPEEMTRMMDDFGMGGTELAGMGTGTGTQTPSSGLLLTPLTGQMGFTGFQALAPVEQGKHVQEPDPMQWVNEEMMQNQEEEGNVFLAKLNDMNVALARDQQARNMTCGGVLKTLPDQEEFDFGDIQF
ncbi:Homeobox protein knotted-1-like 7 [Sphaceloma murrayae]|uniref:Homeobox protein knotted-1-like 7 n=1 Tax=Sphaceloma murrayae TaxID=2082308 RepID=A0A2K1QJQ5_9PEZI|nr:Homeobox protein knotted-1-like 7 [Sphaceloma murrayae]